MSPPVDCDDEPTSTLLSSNNLLRQFARLDRVVFACLGPHAATRCISRQSDSNQKRYSVEEGLCKKRAAQLLDARDAHREDQHRDKRAPHVYTPWPDRRRPEERPDERGQQVVPSDVALRHLELRTQEHACESHQKTGSDVGAYHIPSAGDARQLGRPWVRAQGI